MSASLLKLLKHYQVLWFLIFNRSKGHNEQFMREYFAEVLLSEIEEFTSLWHKKILDVGGAGGEYCKIIHKQRECDCINLEPNPAGQLVWPNVIIGAAEKIPFGDEIFDFVICRGVLEHIPDQLQQKAINEIYRVTRSGGFCYILIPPWYHPHAGHELKPFHLLPFKLAKFLRKIIFQNKISGNSLAEIHLYPMTFHKTVRMIRSAGFTVIATKDTHLRLHFLTRIPVVREFMVPAVAFILRKCDNC